MIPKRDTDMRLSQMAGRLRLSFMRDHMPDMLSAVTQAKMTPRETLEYFFGKEIEQREGNRVRLAFMGAHFPRICTLEGFDMTAQPSLDPGVMRELGQLEWIESAENVLFLGPPGVGKTHLAIALGRLAIQKSHSVRFISASALIETLDRAQSEGRLAEKLAAFGKPQLLIIDELGYLPVNPRCAHLFFQLICRRYESKSTIITSNRPVGEWGMVFGDPTVATAILDRLLHHCIPVTIMGDSYRVKSAVKAKLMSTRSKGNVV